MEGSRRNEIEDINIKCYRENTTEVIDRILMKALFYLLKLNKVINKVKELQICKFNLEFNRPEEWRYMHKN